jgi:hypothetical protein
MPKRRTNKHRGACNVYESAWLEGDRKVGFLFSLNHDFVLQPFGTAVGITSHFIGKRACLTLNRLRIEEMKAKENELMARQPRPFLCPVIFVGESAGTLRILPRLQ